MKSFKTLIILVLLLQIGCVQKEHEKSITFQVDATHLENVKTIGIVGNFTEKRWKEIIPLKDDDKEGIYTVTLTQKTAVNEIEFKFIKNETEYELKDKNNRSIYFEYKP